MDAIANQGLRAIRLGRGHTALDIADRALVSEGFVSRIERGERSPLMETGKRLAKAYGITLGHLYELIDKSRASNGAGDQ